MSASENTTTVYHLKRQEGTMNQANVRVGLERDVNSHSEGRQARRSHKNNNNARETDSYCVGLRSDTKIHAFLSLSHYLRR